MSSEQVLQAIRHHIQEHGYPPAVRDIAMAVDLSPATVHKLLGQLVLDGRLIREQGKPRAIRIVE